MNLVVFRRFSLFFSKVGAPLELLDNLFEFGLCKTEPNQLEGVELIRLSKI